MKLKILFSLTQNKTNKQYIFSLRSKELKKLGMTPEELLEVTMLKPKAKFYKKQK